MSLPIAIVRSFSLPYGIPFYDNNPIYPFYCFFSFSLRFYLDFLNHPFPHYKVNARVYLLFFALFFFILFYFIFI